MIVMLKDMLVHKPTDASFVSFACLEVKKYIIEKLKKK